MKGKKKINSLYCWDMCKHMMEILKTKEENKVHVDLSTTISIFLFLNK